MTYLDDEARWQTHAAIDALLGEPAVDYAAVDAEAEEES